MPGEEKPKAPLDQMIYANGRDHWSPDKYERFGLYVFLYNYVRANLDDFSPQPNGQPSKFKDDSGNYINFELNRTALSTQINDAIYKHYDWFVKHLHLDEPIAIGSDGRDLGIKKDTFLSEFYDHAHQSAQIMQMNSELNGPLKGNGTDKSNMSTDDLLLILRHKEDNVRKYFDDVRNAVEGKPRDLGSDGKPKGGFLTVDMTKALQEKEEFTRQLLEGAGGTLFYGVASAGGLGVATVSAIGILSYGGLAVPSLFGAAFAASPVGMAVLSVTGLIAGVKITKAAIGKFTSSLGNEFGQIKKYFHFMVGMGEYAPKDGIPKGFKPRKERYETGLELKTMMTKFKIPEKASDFDDAFEAFWKETLENSKYLKHFTEKELKELHKNARYTYQVTNGLAEGQGASLFGRLRGLVSAEYPSERVDYKFENADEAYRHFKSTLTARQSGKVNLDQLESDLMWLDANKSFFDNAKREDLHKELLDSYKGIIIKSIDNFAFEEPLNSNTIKSLNKLLTNQAISERIKTGISGGEEQVKSIVSFLSKEKNKGNIIISESYPESTIAQLEFDADVMVDACTGDGFGPERVTGAMVDDVKVVAEFISKFSVEDEKITISGTDYGMPEIENILESNIKANRLAYDYLKFMLGKKRDAAVLDEHGVLKYSGVKSTKLNPANVGEVIGELDSFTIPPDLSVIVGNILSATSGTPESTIVSIKNSIESINFTQNDRQNKNYLYALLFTRIGEVKDANILEEIVQEIAALDTSNFDDGTATEIRNKIKESGLPVSVCIGLTDWALSKQTERLQRKKINDITARTMDGLRRGGCVEFEQLMSEIESLTYETINESSTQQLFDKKIMRGLSSPFKEYFTMALRDKVQKLISDKIVSDAALLQSETGLEKNAEYLQYVSINKFLTDVQKETIYSQIAGYIESAASATVDNLQRNVLVNKEANKEVSGNISTYLTTGYANKGLKEFFASNTEQSQRVYGRLNTFREISNSFTQAVTTMSQYNGKNPYVVDPNSEDAKFIVSAFFLNPNLERTEGDELLRELREIHGVYTGEISSLQGTGLQEVSGGGAIKVYDAADIARDINNVAFLNQMNDKITRISSLLPSKIDQLAALRSLKRHSLEAFKFQLIQAIGQDNLATEDQVRNAINSNKTRFDNIIKVWKKLMHDLDEKCTTLSTDAEIRNATYLEGKSYVEAEQTIDFFNSAKNIFDRLRSNATIQPSM